MEISKKELQAAQVAVHEAQERALVELSELDLVMIGGGSGNEIFA